MIDSSTPPEPSILFCDLILEAPFSRSAHMHKKKPILVKAVISNLILTKTIASVLIISPNSIGGFPLFSLNFTKIPPLFLPKLRLVDEESLRKAGCRLRQFSPGGTFHPTALPFR